MLISAPEAIAIRTKLGLSVDAFAADLGLTPDVVRGWEEGTVRIPARIAKILHWHEGRFDRFKELERSGIPECPWLVAFAAESVPNELKAATARVKRLAAHRKSCELCRAREKLVDEKFGGWPEYPKSWWQAGLTLIYKRVERLPIWAQPAVWLGMGFGAYSLMMILFRLPAISRDPQLILTSLVSLFVSISLGSVIGLLYGAFRTLKAQWQARAK